MKATRIYLATFSFGLLLDQAVKALVRAKLALNQSLNLPWPGVFEIKHTSNPGIAFGMFQGKGYLFAPVAIIITYMAYQFSAKHPQEKASTHFAMGLLSSGAVGNLIDRVAAQQVTDMMWIRIINFPIFNVADMAITFGAIILGWKFLFGQKESAPLEQSTETPAPDSTLP